MPVRLTAQATDSPGTQLRFRPGTLPAGASLADDGSFAWTPAFDQVGPFYVPFQVTDDGDPPLSSSGMLAFAIAASAACRELSCAPPTGCSGPLQTVDVPCCESPPLRFAEPVAECPAGGVLHLGRNLGDGFGRLQDCERFRVINFGQIGATVRFNIEARCLDTSEPMILGVRMWMANRLIVEASAIPVILRPGVDGFARRIGVALPVRGPGPFFEFEGAEANLEVTLEDVAGVVLSQSVRLILTFETLPDLPDLPAPVSPATVSLPEDGDLSTLDLACIK